MIIDVKNIHIGKLIEQRIKEMDIDEERIKKFLKCSEEELRNILFSKAIDSDVLLRFSILLEYDFFRIFSQYLILYSPPAGTKKVNNKNTSDETFLPKFRKSLYTTEVINFILELILSGEKSKHEIMEEYKIPKTTLYRWLEKYRKNTQ